MDVVIISTVRSNNRGAVGFVKDARRLNVAITRGRHCVLIVGNTDTLRRCEPLWDRLVADAQDRGCFVDAAEDTALAKAIKQINRPAEQLQALVAPGSDMLRTSLWQVH